MGWYEKKPLTTADVIMIVLTIIMILIEINDK